MSTAVYIMHTLGLPVLLAQGIYVLKKTPRLAEPKGARVGVCGQGKPLSLLVLGDSAAAGVGVEQQSQALLGQLVQGLSAQHEVHYWLNAKTGRTSRHLIQQVKRMVARPVDVVVTSIGVNDVTQLQSAQTWIAQQRQLYDLIQARFQPKLIVVTAVPPMQVFPALPQPLSGVLGASAAEMNQELAQLVQRRGNMQSVQFDLARYQTEGVQMARDGFHPSEAIYQRWAEAIIEKINRHFPVK